MGISHNTCSNIKKFLRISSSLGWHDFGKGSAERPPGDQILRSPGWRAVGLKLWQSYDSYADPHFGGFPPNQTQSTEIKNAKKATVIRTPPASPQQSPSLGGVTRGRRLLQQPSASKKWRAAAPLAAATGVEEVSRGGAPCSSRRR
jgi:hypothetical protein